MAQTVRRFPLGTVGKRIVVLQLDHRRQRMSKAKGGVGWSGTARLRYLSLSGRWIAGGVDLGKVKWSTRAYGSGLGRLLRKAWAKARRLKGFKPLKAPGVRFCRFKKKCGTVRVRGDHRGASVRLGKRALKRAEYPLSVRKKFKYSLWSGPRQAPLSKASKPVRAAFARAFRLSSVRIYRVGRRRLVVANLAAGGQRHAWPILKRWPRSKCRTVQSCVVPEQTLHHGLAFDAVALY